jgi:hypothetical protein
MRIIINADDLVLNQEVNAAVFSLMEALPLLDGDTWFRKSPRLLFDRVGPGRAVMHIREGHLTEMEIAMPIHRRAVALVSGPSGRNARNGRTGAATHFKRVEL